MAEPSRTRSLVFLTGLALEFYGFVWIADRSSLWGLLWIGLGLGLQIAGEGVRQGSPGGLDAIRRRVQSWDRRE